MILVRQIVAMPVSSISGYSRCFISKYFTALKRIGHSQLLDSSIHTQNVTVRYFSRKASSQVLSQWCCRHQCFYRFYNHNFVTARIIHSTSITLKKLPIEEQREKQRNQKLSKTAPVLDIWKNMTIRELSKSSGRSLDMVFEAMLFVENSEYYDTPDSAIDDIAVLVNIAKKLGYRTKVVAPPQEEKKVEVVVKDAFRRPPPEKSQMIKRPPVVTIMGHVDHGKTTLLDSLRNTSVVEQEFGGITQHIGAFVVKISSGEKITFLDTPGHAAFSAMRARGAHVTDIVVLVVAADDGVMEQTVESIRYAREAEVPLIVAVNKIDKPKADLENVKKGLLSHGIQLEDMGGDTQYVCISALKGTNLDQLIDAILVQADVMDIRGDPKGLVEGVVLESSVHPGRGKLATTLIQRGTLRKGAILVAGTTWGKVRAMFDEWGKNVSAAPPSTPVQIIGWRGDEIPAAGDEVLEVESEKRAHEVVQWRKDQEEREKLKEDLVEIQKKIEEHNKVYKAELQKRREEGRMRKRRIYEPREKLYKDDPTPRLSVIIKGDVDGSVEAILDILDTYHMHQKCRLDVVHFGVGQVTENDLELAEAFKGMIYGFNVNVPDKISQLAKQKSIEVKTIRVIYKLIDDIKERINERLPLVDEEEVFGEANVLQEFLITEGKKKIPVAGCRCTKGMLKKNAMFKVIRDGQTIHEGPLASLRHLKNEVQTIKTDVECGLMLQDPTVRFVPGDTIVCYTMNKVPQKTDWDPGF